MTDNLLPVPPQTPESAEFFKAAAQSRFTLRCCITCSKPHWYPRAICPFCAGATEWVRASGRGSLYAFSTLLRADPPYTLAYVTLDEGPVMMTNIVDADLATLAIGQPVEIAWRRAEDGTPIPCFTPALQPT